MPILQSSTKDRLPARRLPIGGWLGVQFFALAISANMAMGQIQSVYDVESGGALAGTQGVELSITASNVQEMDAFELSLQIFPEGVLENPTIERGSETEGFEDWTVELEPGAVSLIAADGDGGIDMSMGRLSEIGKFKFDVSASAVDGATVALVLDRVGHSLPFEIAADLGVFKVGGGEVTEASRNLEIEFVPRDAFPGDLVHLNVYSHDAPNLYSAQVVLAYPEGALIREGAIGGELVEDLGWSSAFVGPGSGNSGPSVIIDRLFGQHPAPPPGRFQIASIPFRVGADWGGSFEGFEVSVIRAILQGDILARGDNLYFYYNDGAPLVQSPPDLNGDGVVDERDLIEFQSHWKEDSEQK
ncbi:MAG: hypothetical protein KC994_18150 [Candidatus Omnitrophica bacterium]|nr:hypothetical protein [Candidatus Omnitrophota bacterium]